MSPNDADGMATVWSGSALFAQAYPSENLGSLRYMQKRQGNGEIMYWYPKKSPE